MIKKRVGIPLVALLFLSVQGLLRYSNNFNLQSFTTTLSQACTSTITTRTANNNNTASAPALPPVHLNSSWMGNQWIPPPGYRLYSAADMYDYFRTKSVLFVGDSTARRTFATFYAILEKQQQQQQQQADSHGAAVDLTKKVLDHTSVIDVNKQRETEPCDKPGYSLCRTLPRTPPPRGHRDENQTTTRTFLLPQYNLMSASCLGGLAHMLAYPDPDTRLPTVLQQDLWQYDVIVFNIGPWEVMNREDCGGTKFGRYNCTNEVFDALFALDDKYNSHDDNGAPSSRRLPQFVWRTWGAIGTSHNTVKEGVQWWKNAQTHNRYVQHLLDTHERERYDRQHDSREPISPSAVSYIDWGHASLPRMFPQEQRCVGDIDPHNCLEVRLAFVQMLTNHLMERDRQRQHDIVPYVVAQHDHRATSDNHHNNNRQSILEHIRADPHLNAKFLTFTDPKWTMTAAEQEELRIKRLQFCDSCTWKQGISCAYRRSYLENHYQMSALAAITNLMESAESCRLVNATAGTTTATANDTASKR